MNHLCCNVNTFVTCPYCSARFCRDHWNNDRTHVDKEESMFCGSKGNVIWWADDKQITLKKAPEKVEL